MYLCVRLPVYERVGERVQLRVWEWIVSLGSSVFVAVFRNVYLLAAQWCDAITASIVVRY